MNNYQKEIGSLYKNRADYIAIITGIERSQYSKHLYFMIEYLNGGGGTGSIEVNDFFEAFKKVS